MLFKETAFLRVFGAWNIPMIFFLSPTVVELSEKRSVVRIPLTMRSKNHLGSMYFGALATGADCAGGLLAVKHIRARKKKISFVFKDFKAEFLKRPESDVHFICEDGEKIAALVDETITSGVRQHFPMNITAITPKQSADQPVARFILTLSLKMKG